jgi:AcrR family transcriptional regulator
MPTPDHPSPPPVRPLRRDAQRNRDAILAAARQLFCDHGLEAPLEQIARRAGVGIATLYRRFPSRVELLDGFRADRAHPLPQPPLAPRQVHRAMLALGRRSAGDTHEHPATASSAPATAATAQRVGCVKSDVAFELPVRSTIAR